VGGGWSFVGGDFCFVALLLLLSSSSHGRKLVVPILGGESSTHHERFIGAVINDTTIFLCYLIYLCLSVVQKVKQEN
jgi:hypothetical protein